MKAMLARSLSSLAVRNYRLFLTGQVVSMSGSWMQQVAIAWLVLKLTNSVFELGVVTALQTAPSLVVGMWGGLIADRYPKRRLLICTQVAHFVPPILLWSISEQGAMRMWIVYVLVVSRGLINTVDNPARASFVTEMVGGDRVVSAVSLNASVVQSGRLIGPAVASLIIATVGLDACFLVNAMTFAFMVVMLLAMRPEQLTPALRAGAGRGQLRASLQAVRRQSDLRVPLLLMGIVGLLAFNFTVVLPAVARFTFHGTATTYALMMNALAAGALGGALYTGTRKVIAARVVALNAVMFGAALGLAAIVGNFVILLVALVAVGAASVMFSASVQASLQLGAASEMRGRILALYQVVYQGTTPVGALIVGALAAGAGARSGFVLGAAGAVVAGVYGLRATRSRRPRAQLLPALVGGGDVFDPVGELDTSISDL